MSSSWQRRDWWRWQQDSWQRDKWSREPWQQQPWQDSANSHWRGRARPGSGPAQIDPAQLRGLSPAASHSSAGSAEAAQKKGAWRDKKHKFEDHEVLRCPWPGGRRTFPEPPAEGCWAQLEDEALDLGLAPASVINHLRCDIHVFLFMPAVVCILRICWFDFFLFENSKRCKRGCANIIVVYFLRQSYSNTL